MRLMLLILQELQHLNVNVLLYVHVQVLPVTRVGKFSRGIICSGSTSVDGLDS